MNKSYTKTLWVALLFCCPYFAEAQNDIELDSIVISFNHLDEQGRKQGYWQKRYPNGTIAYKAFFTDDKPQGRHTRFHENGKLMAIVNYFDGDTAAVAQLFSQQGKLMAEGTYAKGNRKKQGLWRYFDDNGTLRGQETYDKNSRIDGEQLVYHANGNVFERRRFVHGLQNGVSEQFDEMGQMVFEMMFKAGQQEGKVRYYYSNNQIRIEGQYEHNVRTGRWNFYDQKGNLERSAEYYEGIASDQDLVDAHQNDYLNQLEKNRGRYTEPTDLMGFD